MREIKFRQPIFDKEGKFTVFHYWGLNNDGFIGPAGYVSTRQSGFRGLQMQYTGLKDKNGVEIYEGDVMRVQLPMGGFWGDIRKQKIGVVRYEADHGAFIVEWQHSKNQHHVVLTCDVAFEGEALGSIYENNELLTT